MSSPQEQVIGVLLPPTPPEQLLAALPQSDDRISVRLFHFDEAADALDANGVVALIWVPPTPTSRLIEVFDRMSPSLRWLHSLSAGVDSLAEFISSRLLSSSVQLTNGRGAFSSSLAEYAMAACLHHNKQIARCERNRANGVWDKFIMGTLKGKTLGFIGCMQRHSCALSDVEPCDAECHRYDSRLRQSAISQRRRRSLRQPLECVLWRCAAIHQSRTLSKAKPARSRSHARLGATRPANFTLSATTLCAPCR